MNLPAALATFAADAAEPRAALFHVVFGAAAYAAGFALLRHQRRCDDFLSADVRWGQVLAAVLGAVVGAKALHWLAHPSLWHSYLEHPVLLLGGKTLVGALLGGWVAVEWAKRRDGTGERTGDVYVGPLLLGIAIGRFGCFFAGPTDGTTGLPTTLPWGVDFGDGVPRHPTQLYEIAFVTVLAWLLFRYPVAHRGLRFRAFVLAYLTFRLTVDSLKPYDHLAGLNPIQWACLLVLVAQLGELPAIARWLTGRRPIGAVPAAAAEEPP